MNATEENRIPAESIDHRLSAMKMELDRIYRAQDELLKKIHPNLREDFLMTRADRIRSLTQEERENYSLLNTWAVHVE